MEKEPEEILVGIQPFEGFNTKLTDTVVNAITQVYGFKLVVMPEIPLPQSAFVNVKSPRYRADSLIRFLKRNKPDSIDYILALTHKDISVTKKDKWGNVKEPYTTYYDYGIFGLGYCPGPSCIVSVYRLHNNDMMVFFGRLKKICVHELGHNLGLKHCPDKSCVMTDALESIKTVDHAKLGLCDNSINSGF